ncbi:helix-turn-helix domain-containing protein [Sphingomicrobium clamense]|uniref:Helix-turn-helix transcriptional regulator n=1 Tax=Sphingomicrobium clamense TaxID=2851013 RepID=A0ABS6V571_9SPHN|nr:helix-turn-helix transcriptional regulator [Sphingomicrobium sp. B8]MBW0144684.1 helix-turn-helix transcriptional regulator [Sphingomicrobium sp. B8]
MISRIREVRKAKGMTLSQVAEKCEPKTTAQTIGRLETGMRTLSVDWLNRIANALGVDSAELVDHPRREDVGVAAILGPHGVHAPEKAAIVLPPSPSSDQVAITVATGVGDYRAGDEIWCRKMAGDDFGKALNKDVLVPRPAGRFLFGRMIDRDGDKFLLLPITAGGRQQVVTDPPWIAMAETLVRKL